jgi:hypothetical protein
MQLQSIDLAVIGLFFLSMLVIGIMSYYRSKNAEDYFVAGGKLPWWLAGISHHVSGHSGAVFVAYAAVAFTHGFTMYIWWALPVGLVIIGAAGIFPVYWVRLRKQLQIQSPLEYLRIRYNLLTQQVVAWNGVLLKVFDVGAKWAAIGILLKVVAGIPMETGIMVSGVVTLVYVTFGGLWGVIVTDFIQFIVQVLGSIVMGLGSGRSSLLACLPPWLSIASQPSSVIRTSSSGVSSSDSSRESTATSGPRYCSGARSRTLLTLSAEPPCASHCRAIGAMRRAPSPRSSDTRVAAGRPSRSGSF